MSFTISTQSKLSWRRSIPAFVFVVVLFVSLSLAFLEWFTDVRTTVIYDWRWLTSYVTVLLILFSSMSIALYRAKAKIDIDGGWIKKTGYLLAGLIGFSFLTGGAVFSGIPILLHQTLSAPGELVVTVERKEDNYRRRKCTPRLIVKEFTFIGNDYLCVNEQAFNEIQLGSKIKLKGIVSTFGIEPEEIFWTVKMMAN